MAEVEGPSTPGQLAAVRGEWLDEALSSLRADPRVEGVALVGSLGRGEADDWSDVDLLVVVGAPAPPGPFAPWGGAELVVDARQNAPAGATSVGTLYVRSGLPLGVDWYVHPAPTAVWPSDCRVVHEATARPRVDDDFRTFIAAGPRQAGITKSAEEIRLARLAMVPIAGKYIARRSPAAGPMIRFLGGPAPAPGSGPADELRALRALAADLSTGALARPRLVAAVAAHLAIVGSTIGGSAPLAGG